MAVALSRLAATFLPAGQAAAVGAQLLAPLYSPQAICRFQKTAAAADATLQQPWDAAQQQQLLPLVRAAVAGVQAAARLSCSSQGAQPLPAAASATAQTLLLLLPPGDEPAALQLLAVLLGPQPLAGTAAVAAAALQSAAGSGVAQLAADSRSQSATAGSSPPELPSAQLLSQVLLSGYAAAWLGLVPEQQQEQDEPAEFAAAAAALEPPAAAALLRPQGELVLAVAAVIGQLAAQILLF